MKLIQLNTLSGLATGNIFDFFVRERAHFLMLQEVMSSPEGRSDFFDFLERMQKYVTGLKHIFFSKTHRYQFNHMPVYFGNAILSKIAFAKTYDEFTYLDYMPDYDTRDTSVLPKLFQHATVKINGTILNLVNYHGHNVKNTNKRGNEETKAHCQSLADYIDTLQGPVILTGDFNLAADSESLAPLNARLTNLCIAHDVATTRNALAKTMTTVDYIWVSADITVNRFEVLPDIVSDHAALLLDFDIQ